MKKLLGLLVLVFLVGCGINIDTEVNIESESGEVSLVSHLEFSQEDYDYIEGGKDAVATALEDNLWDGASITENDDTFEITTDFDSIDSYNEFMEERIGEVGIDFESSVNLISVDTEYVFSDNVSSYIDDYISTVFDELEYTDNTIGEDDLVAGHYVSNYFDGENIYSSTYVDREEYKHDDSKATIEFEIEVVKDGKKDAAKLDYTEVGLELNIEIEEDDENFDTIKKDFEDLGFTTSYKKGILNVEKTYDPDKDFSSDTYVDFYGLECEVVDAGLFSNTYNCDYELGFGGLFAEVILDDVYLTEDVDVEYYYGSKNITDDLGKEFKDYHVSRIIIFVVSILLFLVAIVVVLIILKKKNSDVGEKIVDKTKKSFNTLKNDFSNSSFGKVEEESFEDTTVLEKINNCIDIKLLSLLLILTTPIYSLSLSGLGDELAGEFSTGGSLFLTDIGTFLGQSIIPDQGLGFVNALRVILAIVVLAMMVKFVLVSLNLLKLTPMLNKIIDIVFYSLNILIFVIFLIKSFTLDFEETGISFAYVLLLFISIYGLVKSIGGFNFKRGFDVYSKYLILLLLSTFLNLFKVTASIEGLFSMKIAINFSQWFVMSNSVGYAVIMAVILISSLILIIIKLKIKLDYRINSGVVIGHVLFFVISLIVMAIRMADSVDVEVDEVNVSFGLTFMGVLYLIIIVAMIVYSVFDFIKNLKGKSNYKEAETETIVTSDNI